MKKIAFLFILILSGIYSVSAQDLIKATQLGINTNTKQKTNQIAKQVAAKRLSGDNTMTLFQVSDKKRIEYEEYVSNEIYFDLDKNELRKIFENEDDYLVLDIPVADSKSFQVELIRTNIFSDNFQVVTSDGNILRKEDIPGVFYQGIVKDNENSIVSFSIFENHIEGLIADDYGNYILGQLKDTDTDTYVLYNDKALKVESNLSCGVTEEMEAYVNTQVDNTTHKSMVSGCIDIYVEADYATYQDHGNSTTNVNNFVTSLFNQVSTLYANEGISVQLSEVFVWTSSDPYLADSSTGAVLSSFRNNRPTFNGDLAHFISTRSLGGGIAWVDALCSSFSYAVSTGLNTNIVPFPTYSWNVYVFAHEMGHNFGSSHTQDCVWNDNDTQIDDCGSVAGDVQPCYDSSAPIIPSNGGTIMSYCHLSSAGSAINFNLGFGQQPGDLIRDRYNNASCAGSCGGTTCTNTITSFPYSEGFEIGLGAWAQDTGDDINWTIFITNTPSSNTGPSSAAQLTYYLYTEATGNYNKVANLISPCFDLSSINNPTLTFKYHMYGAAMGTMRVQVSTNNGSTWTTLWTKTGDQGNSWKTASVNLNNYTTQTALKLRFSGTTGSGSTSDIAIDDINLSSEPVQPNSCRHSDSLALVALYNSTNGTNWINAWNLNQPMDTWYGVTLNEDGCVDRLDIGSNNLTGNIPPQIGDLGNLTALRIWHNNNLTGNIPPEIGNLSNLIDLYLYDNNHTGNIPPEVGNLSNLMGLTLPLNQLTGSIPSEIGNLNNLTALSLPDNQLSGNIPPEIGNLNDLQILYVHNNQLTGNIPSEIGNLSNLISMWLKNNQLTGCYDTSLSQFCDYFLSSRISDGNNFDASWDDFCLNDTGTCDESGNNCSSRVADPNLVVIGGKFGQFANEEFTKNFIVAEKGYIRYQAEINRILESKEVRYAKVNEDFDQIKSMAMPMLFKTFAGKGSVTITDEHIKAIDNFLFSLSEATSKGKLRDEIAKVRRYLHVMENKEVKNALIAFDRAGISDISKISPFYITNQDGFEAQLLNAAGREPRITYNTTKRGTLNVSLYNTNGEQIRTLYNSIAYEGHHQIPIDKNGLSSGIYFIHIKFIANGVPINKVLKLPILK